MCLLTITRYKHIITCRSIMWLRSLFNFHCFLLIFQLLIPFSINILHCPATLFIYLYKISLFNLNNFFKGSWLYHNSTVCSFDLINVISYHFFIVHMSLRKIKLAFLINKLFRVVFYLCIIRIYLLQYSVLLVLLYI